MRRRSMARVPAVLRRCLRIIDAGQFAARSRASNLAGRFRTTSRRSPVRPPDQLSSSINAEGRLQATASAITLGSAPEGRWRVRMMMSG